METQAGNGVADPSTLPLEGRLDLAQAGGLEANLRRMLAFVQPRGALEFEALGVRDGRYIVNRAAHSCSPRDAIALCTTGDKWHSDGLYVLPAQLHEGVETRYCAPGSWYAMKEGGSTKDIDIAARLVLGVDCDVKRPTMISATDAQMEMSVATALDVHAYLLPLVGEDALAYVHSGNGRQLWLALDAIPANEGTKLLCKSILTGLGSRFTTAAVAIDLKLSDAKRLLPAAGTRKKKGAEGIAERPHRRTAIVTPARVRRLREDDLRELHARIRSDCDEPGRAEMDKAIGIKVAPKPGPGPAKASAASGDLRQSGESPFKTANAQDPQAVAEWLDLLASGNLLCPGCGNSAGVDVIKGGLKCFHNTCDGKGKSGFRTNVDLTMEVRGVDARAAVNLLAERFGFEGVRERAEREASSEPPPGFYDEPAGGETNGSPYSEYKKDETGFRIWTPAEIFAPLPEQAFAVAGLLVKGSLALVVALGESLKTWMAADAVMATATGGKWLGRFDCAKGAALFIDYEAGDYEWRRRAIRLALGRELVLPVEGMALVSMPPFALTSDEFFRELERLATQYSVIAIDSLTGGAGGADENDARFAAPLYRLKSIAARTGCVIIVLHHTRKTTPTANGKGETDPREMVRGSSAIFNAVDVVLYLTRDGDDRFRVRQTKARGGKRVEPFTVRVDDLGVDASIVRSADVGDDDADAEASSKALAKARQQIVALLGREKDLRSKDEIYNRITGTKSVRILALKELLDPLRKLVVLSKTGAYRLASEV